MSTDPCCRIPDRRTTIHAYVRRGPGASIRIRVRQYVGFAVLFAALGFLTLLSGCEHGSLLSNTLSRDAAAGKDRSETVTVVVSDRLDGEPRAGVKIVLMDADANVPCCPPLATDENGSTTFTDIPAGHYAVVVFPGAEYDVYHLPGTFHLPPAPDEKWPMGLVIGHDVPGLVTEPGTEPGADDTRFFHVLTRDRNPPGGLPRIQGTVVDGESGEPLAGAFLALYPEFAAYLGQVNVWDDVTLADGLFSVSNIPFAQDPYSGDLIQVLPVFAMHDGYWPVPYIHELAPGDDNVNIIGVVIELFPDEGIGTSALTGTMVFDGEPAPNVTVGLSYYGPLRVAGGKGMLNDRFPDRLADEKSSVGMPGRTTVTDANGTFLFSELPAGGYFAFPAFRAGDEHTFYDPENNYVRLVGPGQTVDTGPLNMVRTIRQKWPAPAAVLPPPVTVLAWSTVKEADRYLVYLDYELVGSVESATYLELPGDEVLYDGHHIWAVVAKKSDGTIVGITKQSTRFLVE